MKKPFPVLNPIFVSSHPGPLIEPIFQSEANKKTDQVAAQGTGAAGDQEGQRTNANMVSQGR